MPAWFREGHPLAPTAQDAVASRFLASHAQWTDKGVIESSDLGRAACKVESLAASLNALHSSFASLRLAFGPYTSQSSRHHDYVFAGFHL